MAILVGVVGIITIVGLSDLMFILPQQTSDQSFVTPTPEGNNSLATSSNKDITIPLNFNIE